MIGDLVALVEVADVPAKKSGYLHRRAARMCDYYDLSGCALNTVSAACGDYERQKLKDPPADLIPVAALQDCLQHSAVSLSSGPDAADQIATAIVVACDREIEAEAKREQATMDAPSDRIRVSLKVYVHDQALLAIVKARAEKCSLVDSH